MLKAKKAKKKPKGKDPGQVKQKMSTGAMDEDVYSDTGRELLLEDDEISAEEEGFMEGFEHGEHLAKCSRCDKTLLDDFIEKEIGGDIYRFCSEDCAELFEPNIE